jgi:hypothetical protein
MYEGRMTRVMAWPCGRVERGRRYGIEKLLPPSSDRAILLRWVRVAHGLESLSHSAWPVGTPNAEISSLVTHPGQVVLQAVCLRHHRIIYQQRKSGGKLHHGSAREQPAGGAAQNAPYGEVRPTPFSGRAASLAEVSRTGDLCEINRRFHLIPIAILECST